MNADALAKRMYAYLAAGDCHNPELRRLGWFDFTRYDLPQTTDARVFAGFALHRLLIDDSGSEINHDGRVLYATLAFVQAERGGEFPTAVSKGLLRVLSNRPVVEDEIVAWFVTTFP